MRPRGFEREEADGAAIFERQPVEVEIMPVMEFTIRVQKDISSPVFVCGENLVTPTIAEIRRNNI